MKDLAELLRSNPYPGRGIVVGKDLVCYFIMGRSENSRNRVFARTADGIRTEAHDPARMRDPSLVIYHPVRRLGGDLIVTNGDQTDTIRDVLAAGGSFRDALMRRVYEPDAPHYTPRISALVRADGSFELAILKRAAGRCLRAFYCYEGADEGRGYFLSTYEGDGEVLPSFAGEPVEVSVPAPEAVWAALHPENKVSMYVGSRSDGREILFNKHRGD